MWLRISHWFSFCIWKMSIQYMMWESVIMINVNFVTHMYVHKYQRAPSVFNTNANCCCNRCAPRWKQKEGNTKTTMAKWETNGIERDELTNEEFGEWQLDALTPNNHLHHKWVCHISLFRSYLDIAIFHCLDHTWILSYFTVYTGYCHISLFISPHRYCYISLFISYLNTGISYRLCFYLDISLYIIPEHFYISLLYHLTIFIFHWIIPGCRGGVWSQTLWQHHLWPL